MKEMKEKFGTKNLIKIGLAIIAIIVIVVVASLMYHAYFYKKSFSEIEQIMVDAALEYYSDHQKNLPQKSNETVNIKTDTLISGEYMRPIGEYLKDDEILCKGSVNITNINGKYRYVPLLDCGKDYTYVFITDYIKKHNRIVTSGDGLYQNGNNYVFRGEKVNNYVSFAGNEWQIIKIEDDKIYLIFNGVLERTSWDDRYNKDRDSYDGINNYSVSRIKEYLDKLYKGNSLFSDDDKLLVVPYNVNVSKIGEDDKYKYGDEVSFTNLDNQNIGILSVYDYMNASLDTDCTYPISPNCSNYNYSVKYDYNFWLSSADKNTSYYVYITSYDQGAYLNKASSNGYVRPVIAISKDAIYVSGKGTSKSPYIFK